MASRAALMNAPQRLRLIFFASRPRRTTPPAGSVRCLTRSALVAAGPYWSCRFPSGSRHRHHRCARRTTPWRHSISMHLRRTTSLVSCSVSTDRVRSLALRRVCRREGSGYAERNALRQRRMACLRHGRCLFGTHSVHRRHLALFSVIASRMSRMRPTRSAAVWRWILRLVLGGRTVAALFTDL